MKNNDILGHFWFYLLSRIGLDRLIYLLLEPGTYKRPDTNPQYE